MRVTGTIRLKQLVPTEDLDDPEDRDDLPAGDGGRGSFRDYDISVTIEPGYQPRNEGESLEESALLDEFNRTVAVGCLEDFQQDVMEWKTVYE